MYCYHHPERDAVANCVACSQPVCPECKVEYGGRAYCNACIAKIASGSPLPAVAAIPVNTSGMGRGSPVPPGLGDWNWGGFLLTFIWGIGNSVWWSFLVFVPYLGAMVMPWVLAFKGNEWAWQSRHWESVEHFKRVQRTWAMWGIWLSVAITVVICLMLFAGLALLLWGFNQTGTRWY